MCFIVVCIVFGEIRVRIIVIENINVVFFFKSALGLEEKRKNIFAENASMMYFKTFWSVHF